MRVKRITRKVGPGPAHVRGHQAQEDTMTTTDNGPRPKDAGRDEPPARTWHPGQGAADSHG